MEAQIQPSRRLAAGLIITLLIAASVSACNTIEGAGEDITAAGQAVDRSAERAQGAEETPAASPQPMTPPAPTSTAPATTTP